VSHGDRSFRRWRHALLGAGTIAAAMLVVGLYSARYVGVPDPVPVGFDTPVYRYRANVIAHGGTDALRGWSPSYVDQRDARLTTAALWALLGSATGREPGELALLWPAAMAAAAGLAAATFARTVWQEPSWSVPVYLIATGASVQIARTAGGSLDNLTADPVVLVAAAAALTAAATGRRGLAGAAVLVAAMVPIHWVFATVIGALLVAVGLLLVPDAIRQRRAGASWTALPAARLAAVAIGGQAVGWGALLAIAGLPTKGPRLQLEKVLAKDAARSTSGPVWATGVTAAVGAVRFRTAGAPARWGMWFMLLWAASVPAAAVALHLLDLSVPSYRVIAFGLAFPVLATAAVVWLVQRLLESARDGKDRRGEGLAIVAGAIVVAGALAVTATWSLTLWRSHEAVVAGGAAQAEIAAAYVEQAVPVGPVVFLTTFHNPRLPDRVARAAMPGAAAERVVMAAGRLEDLADGEPTVGVDRLAEASAATWPTAGRAIADGAPVLQLTAFTRDSLPLPGARAIGPGVYLVQGPEPPVGVGAPMPEVRSLAELVMEIGGLLVVVGLVGAGWAWVLGPGDRTSRSLASIPVGVAVLSLVAISAGALGIAFTRTNALVMLAGAAILGIALALISTSVGRATDPAPGTTAPRQPAA
jgi:hypothetical protein